MWHRYLPDLLPLFIWVLCCLTTGVNGQTPSVALDGNPETPGISPVSSWVIPGERLMIAVTARQIQAMHSYSVKCSFDIKVVRFDGAVAKLSPLTPAFLETGDGKMAAFLSIPGKHSVEIAATQSGNDPQTAVSGDGILGFLSFTAKAEGNPHIIITEARIIDPQGKDIHASIR
jgi:hypothetical protein